MNETIKSKGTKLFNRTRNAEQSYLKIIEIMNNINNKIPLRNILIVAAIAIAYMSGKYYQATHKPITYTTIKIKHVKTN